MDQWVAVEEIVKNYCIWLVSHTHGSRPCFPELGPSAQKVLLVSWAEAAVCTLWRGTCPSGSLPDPEFCACPYRSVRFAAWSLRTSGSCVSCVVAAVGAGGVAAGTRPRGPRVLLTLFLPWDVGAAVGGWWGLTARPCLRAAAAAPSGTSLVAGEWGGLSTHLSLPVNTACGPPAGAAREEVPLASRWSASPSFRKKGNGNPSPKVLRYIRESIYICTYDYVHKKGGRDVQQKVSCSCGEVERVSG